MGRKYIMSLLFLIIAVTACGIAETEEYAAYNNTPAPAEPSPRAVVNPFHFSSLHLTSYQCPFDIERTLWHDGYLTLADEFYDVPVRLRGRGNSTWRRGPDKRPLRLRFGAPVYMMGSAYAARDWILLANHFDRSLLRNYAALTLAARLGEGGRMYYLSTARHVHLYVNGEYMGVYLLTDERDPGPARLGLERNPDPSKSGFFIELNSRAGDDGVYGDTYFGVYGNLYEIRFPGGAGRTPEHTAYARAYIEGVSNAIRYRRWECVENLIDVDSFVDFYIVQELFKSPDAHALSVFMKIRGEGDNRRLYLGPLWDFDLAAGNTVGRNLGHGPELVYVGVMHYWFRNLLEMPEFFAAVTARWNEIRDVEIADVIYLLRETAYIYQADFERNFYRHSVMGEEFWNVPPELVAIEDFMGQAGYLIDWLTARVNWLDDFFNGRMYGHIPLLALAEYQARSAHIAKNGERLSVPLIRFSMRDTHLVELTAFAAAFGLYGGYDNGEITLSRGDFVITNRLQSADFTINGTAGRFEVSSAAAGNIIFIPVEPMLSALGLSWSRDPATRVLEITYP